MERFRLPEILIILGSLLILFTAIEILLIHTGLGIFDPVYLIFLASMIPFVAGLIGGGVWLRRGHLSPDRYRRIGIWTITGVGFLGGLFMITGPLMMSPAETVGAVRWGIAVGGGAGLMIGIFEARAMDHERQAERRRTRARELERRTDRLEEFSRIVSHDLRNPLTVAMGRLELAQAEFESEHLDVIERSLDRVEVILSETLDLARQGQVITEPVPVNLEDLAHQAWNNVETKEGTLRLEGSLDLDGDPDRLGQVFENLFRNAIEHGGPSVTVGVGVLPDETGFYVQDDGPGIPLAKRERIFEPGETTKREGTGFGLTIVRSIITAHDWDIEATAGENGGARFEVYLHATPSSVSKPEEAPLSVQ